VVQIAVLSVLFTLLELWFLGDNMNDTTMYAYHDIVSSNKS